MIRPCPQEHHEQVSVFREAKLRERTDPRWSLLYAVPNAAKRSPSVAARMITEGLKSGVPDLCLPVACGGYHGLYIELKRVHGSTTSDMQKEWIARLRLHGNCAEVCKGAEAAVSLIRQYLDGKICQPNTTKETK